mmetsp:Transcript_839/g.1226  ORF Transcript_839/g.1226 Transcript_839/m.1226 type:complete len:84 (+) Transcript_839:693-944(+)
MTWLPEKQVNSYDHEPLASGSSTAKQTLHGMAGPSAFWSALYGLYPSKYWQSSDISALVMERMLATKRADFMIILLVAAQGTR